LGEIYLRGPLLNDFTYNNDDAKRREIALGDLVTVGDIGYQDADGSVFLCDRKRDMIISRWRQHLSRRDRIGADPDAGRARLRGVRHSDEEFGEQICAYVEPQAGLTPDAARCGATWRNTWHVTRCPRSSSSALRYRGKTPAKSSNANCAPHIGKDRSQHLRSSMSDDDVILSGKIKNKLIDSKQKWAEDGRLLTGKDRRTVAAPAARPAPGRDLAGARSRHPAGDPDPRLAAVRRWRSRQSDDLEVGRVHRSAQDDTDHRHPLRHRLVALRQQVGGRERA